MSLISQMQKDLADRKYISIDSFNISSRESMSEDLLKCNDHDKGGWNNIKLFSSVAIFTFGLIASVPLSTAERSAGSIEKAAMNRMDRISNQQLDRSSEPVVLSEHLSNNTNSLDNPQQKFRLQTQPQGVGNKNIANIKRTDRVKRNAEVISKKTDRKILKQNITTSGSILRIMPRYIMPPVSTSTVSRGNSSNDVNISRSQTVSAIKKSTPPKDASTENTVKNSAPHINDNDSINTKVADRGYIQVVQRPLSTEKQLQQQYFIATGLFNSKKYNQSIQHLQDILSIKQNHHSARTLLSRALINNLNISRAEEVLKDGIRIYPNHVAYAVLYASILAKQGRDQLALETLQGFTIQSNKNPEFHALLAGLYQRTGNAIASVKHYKNALRIDSTRGEWWVGLAISNEQLGELDLGKRAYTEALKYSLNSDIERYVQQRLLQSAVNNNYIE